MKTKHTPGPWRFTDDCIGNGKGYYIQTVDMSHRNTFIGDVGGGLQSKDEIKANAKVMAAAPDMLEALNEAQALIKEILPLVRIQMNQRLENGYFKTQDDYNKVASDIKNQVDSDYEILSKIELAIKKATE